MLNVIGSLTWNLDGKTGTNNFYLSGTGNFLMNQIGHLPKNSASILESFLFSNSVFYVSQRKQCEVCAANQHGQETVHFVRRINSANADAVLSALQAGGSYWYPIDGCYQLTEDLTLPEDWKPIKGFKGHWNSDVYTVTLNSKGTPLLDNTRMDGESGWNLGVNRAKGTQTVFNSGMTRTTGVARVLGDLNDLFGTDMDYAGYTVKMYNLGKGWSLVFSGTLSHNVWMENGHKYYVLAKFGDYFDANGYGPISCSALGIYARNNWCSDYNAWMSGVDDVYTYYGAAGNVAFNMSYEGHGTDYTGNYAVLYYLNVYDLTAAFGAGKEPDAAQCRTWFYGGSNPMANADYVASKTVTVGEQIITDVRHYAVEYDIPSLAFAVTDHSAEDETYIGTNAKYTPQPGDKTVTAIIDGNSKVYDGVQISPSAFTVYGAEGASESLFNITYTVEQGSYASYSPRTVNGSSWRDTGAVNAARYHAVAALTDAAIKAGWHINSFDANSTSNPKGWLSITGLKGTDKIELKDSFFKLGAFAPDNSTIAFGKQTPVGRYPVTETGITEANLPVLKNYIVSVYDGQLEIEPREVVVTASDGDWYVEDEGVPEVHATFEVQNDDRETYRLVGADNEASYANMLLMNSDTVEKFIRVTDGTAPAASSSTGQLRKILTSEAREYEEDGVKSTMLRNGSNIWYDTAWYVHAPARYLDLEAEYTLYPCEWCEQYHGFAMGTDHWHITGYETKVNQDAEKGDVLTVATVENPLGETVQNYKLRFVSGTLRVHPKLRFQLKATVPMYVCMYAYNGDGEVVEPTEYGITNYSNGAIRVTDINVDPTGGFLITDKAPLDLLRGEMSMNMFGTQLVPGANTPANPERWIAAADESEGVDGVFLHLPLECYIAGGNVNDETVCTPVTKVQYTIAEYGKTVPEVDDAELPEYIHGEPVTPSTTG